MPCSLLLLTSKCESQVFSTKQFIEKTPEERASIMRTFTESEIADVEAAIAVMPHFDIEYQAFVKVSHARRRYCVTAD
jgi:hypothetical protein